MATSERTPLLRAADEEYPPAICNPSLWVLIVIFSFGASVGGYLLYIQAQDFPISRPFFLIHRINWGSRGPSTGPPYPTPYPLPYVAILQMGRSCDSIDSCSVAVVEIQTCDKTGDVPLNFLIGGDGNTYEGQGWSNQSLINWTATDEIEATNVLVLAFIGNFTGARPNSDQVAEAQVWISESIARGRLRDDYLLVGLRNLTRAPNDAEFLLEDLKQWPQYNRTMAVYL